MILPQNVKGTNRIRDAKIIESFCEEGKCQTEIAKHFKLSQPRIATILKNNSISIISHRKDWEKLKRINSMNRMLNNKSLKDADSKLDVLKELRKEYEGDKPLIENKISNISINVKELSADHCRTRSGITSGSV